MLILAKTLSLCNYRGGEYLETVNGLLEYSNLIDHLKEFKKECADSPTYVSCNHVDILMNDLHWEIRGENLCIFFYVPDDVNIPRDAEFYMVTALTQEEHSIGFGNIVIKHVYALLNWYH